jgi:hypothetical protein
VPEEGVAAHYLVVRLRKGDEVVGGGEIEEVFLRVNDFPLNNFTR